ncbi:zinc finger C2HC domain-containing protein 1C [Discoglossus pictus]
MARLQMAPYHYREDLTEAKLPSLRSEAPATKVLSRLEQMRNEYQERVIREKDEKLLSLIDQKQENTSKRVNGFSRGHAPHHAEVFKHTERKQMHLHKQPSALHQNVRGVEEKNWASNWTVPKKSVGVDRAHPLKPVIYHKYPGTISNIHRSPSANTAALKPLAPLEHIRSKSGPSRTEQWYQLQETEFSLEAEIRRKEALLREKLRRTEEELRRIQREKEQAELEERRTREIQEGRRKAAKAQKKVTKNYAIHGSTDEDEGRYRRQVHGRPYKIAESNPLIVTPSPPPADLKHKVEKIKQVSSNTMRAPHIQPASPKYAVESYVPSSKTQPTPAARNPEVNSDSEEGEEEELSALDPPDELDVTLVPCRVCGRRFAEQRLEKHMLACKKMQSSKRKVFDSSKARAKGTELEQYLRNNRRAPARTPPVQNNTWRQKHESFMRTIRQAREVQHVIAKGGKLSDLPPPPPEENPDYVPCPHCGRRFAPRAAERHIPKCETIKSKPRPPPRQRR